MIHRSSMAYQENLESILNFTGGKNVLNTKQTAEYLGMKVDTVKKHFPMRKWGISAPTLAMILAQPAEEGAEH